MKTPHLITINGKCATRYWLRKPEDLLRFYSLAKKMVEDEVVVISSWMKTDIFYLAESERHQVLLHLLCSFNGKACSEDTSRQFEFSSGQSDTLEHFFGSMLRLNCFPGKGFDSYRDAMVRAFLLAKQERNSGLLEMICRCAGHICLDAMQKRLPIHKLYSLYECMRRVGKKYEANDATMELSLSSLSHFTSN